MNEADSGRSFVLNLGDRMVVQLSGPAIYTWSEPTSSDALVLNRYSGSTGAAATATFLAAARGRTQVSATDNPNCYPRCLPPSRLFQVTVVVR